MRIEIAVDPGTHPSGTIVVDGSSGERFESWLGLLRVLSAALEADAPARAASSLGGQLAPGGDADLGQRV
jgi:hypothetical protein